jgi:methylated-DNA-protein-cysteine methyltransferase-like protein
LADPDLSVDRPWQIGHDRTMARRAEALVHGEVRVLGPGFRLRVWALVRRVPSGRVTTYGQIATLLGSPRVARHVGYAMAAAGDAKAPVPWHRVINTKGRISHRGDFARAQRQVERLEAEGIEFDDTGRVDLHRYLWDVSVVRERRRPIDPGLPTRRGGS